MWYVRTRQWYGLRRLKMKQVLFQIVRERLALGRFAGAGWPITYLLCWWSLEKHGPLKHVPLNETSSLAQIGYYPGL